MSVYGIGKVNFAGSYISYFVLLAGLGIGTYAVREGAKYRDNPKKINQFTSEIFTINIVSTAVSYFLLFLSLIVFAFLRNYLVCILVFSIQILFTTLGTEWVYSIFEEYGFITLRSIIFQIISIIFLFVFVRNPSDYISYALITVFSSVGSNLINFIYARKFCKVNLTWHVDWKKHMTPIFIIFASSVAVTIYVNSDITILGVMKNNYIVGIYSVSSKIYTMVKTLLSSLLIVTIPRLSMLYGKKYLKEYKTVLTNVLNSLVLFLIPAMVGLILLSQNVVLIISGEKYIRSTNSLQILCLALLFSIIASFLSGCILIPIKREKDVFKGSIVSAIINIIFNIILVPFWDENAAAVSTVIAELVIMFFNMYYAKDYVKEIFLTKQFLRNLRDILIGSVGIALVCYLTLMGYKSNILQTFISIILSVFIYIAILFALNNNIVLNILKNVREKYLNKRSL